MSQALSQSLSQSQRPACVQCGGTEYILEFGHYFCADCQVQSQDIREEVFDEYTGGQRGIKVAIPGLKSQETPSADVSIQIDKRNVTSWEALNFILHGLVNELILLGAPEELKTVVIQLWARYLMKMEAAFISKSIEKRPRLGLTFRKSDAQCIYGTDYQTLRAQKNPIHKSKRRRSSSVSDSESGKSDYVTKRTEKYMLTMKKKKLATAEYAASTSASSQGSELTLENLSSISPRLSAERSRKTNKLNYTKDAKNALLNLLDNAELVEDFDRSHLQKRVFNKHALGLEHVTIKKLLIILQLSLLILDSNIHLGDLLRWSDEGYLSLLNAEKLIPRGISVNKDVKKIFVSTLHSRLKINTCTIKMAEYLKINVLKSRMLPLIERYINELCLPGEIFSIIKRFIALKPPSLSLKASINYEARALSYIIFVLKFLFGLDGETEKRISKFASMVNNDNDTSEKLFVWRDWVRFINCRNSLLSAHHQISRDYYYPTSKFKGHKAFLSEWENVPAKQTLGRDHIIDKDLSECMKRFLSGLRQEPVEPLAPSLNPKKSMTDTLLNRNVDIHPRTREILQHDFTLDSISYLTNEECQKLLCEKYGVSTTSSFVADFIQVKPLSENNSVTDALPSFRLRANKVSVELVDYDYNAYSIDKKFSNNKSHLPNHDDLFRGVRLKKKHDSKKDRLLFPKIGRGYWIYHGYFKNCRSQVAVFDHVAQSVFSPDFFWLLKEAAHVGNLCPKELYNQLAEIENVYVRYLSNCTRFKGSCRNW